jgi:hypothetical protein
MLGLLSFFDPALANQLILINFRLVWVADYQKRPGKKAKESARVNALHRRAGFRQGDAQSADSDCIHRRNLTPVSTARRTVAQVRLQALATSAMVF